MSSILELKTGLKDRLATIAGARPTATQPATPTDNTLSVLGPVRWTYDTTFDGLAHYFFEVGIYLNPADLGRAQTRLDAYLAPTGAASILAAVRGDETLGGTAHFARVIGGTEYGRLVDVAGSQMLYASVDVEVRAT